MLDLRRLRIFAAVAEGGSFTAAATALFLTQPAVSQQMAILEREVGVPLLVRVPRGIQLTDAGKLLADRAARLLTETAEIEDELRRFGQGTREVALGAFPTAGADMVPLAIRSSGGGTLTRGSCSPRRTPTTWSPSCTARGSRSGWSGTTTSPRRPPTRFSSGSNSSPTLSGSYFPRIIRPRASERSPCAISRRNRGSSAPPAALPAGVRAHVPDRRFEPRVAFRTDNYQSIQGLVAAGIGLGLAPRLSLTPRRPDVVAIPVAAPSFSRRIAALAVPGSNRPSTVDDLLDVLRTTADALYRSPGE